jgi:HK97 family phage major capsid protein
MRNKLQMTALALLIGATMTREAPADKPMPDFNAKGELQRALEVSGFDVEKRTVELAFSSEIEAERWFGIEILDHSPGSVRLDRLRDGGAALVDHNWTDQIGVVESVTIGSDRRGRAVVRFGRSVRANEIFQDVVDGIRKHVSVGYRVLAAKLVETRDEVDVYRITDWEPFEISFVAVPLDHSVGVGRTMEKTQEEQTTSPVQTASVESGAPAAKINSEEVREMKEKILRDSKGNLVRAMVDEAGKITEVLEVIEEAGADARAAGARALEAERARSSSILAMGEQYNCRELAQTAAQGDVTVDAFRAQVLEHMNTRGQAPATSARSAPARNAQTPLTDASSPIIGLSDDEIRQYSIFRAVRALQPNASRADREAAAFELECSEAAQRQMGVTAQGILVPYDVLSSRAFNAGGAANSPAGAQTGSNLVQTDLMAGSFIDMLRNRTTLMRLATVIGGLVGNVDIPKQTGGATAYWLGEGDDTTEGSPTIGQLGLTPKTVGAYTDITRRLLMQSTPDAEGIVRRDLANAMAQAIDLAGYYGPGTGNQPRGIKNYTGINAVDFAGLWPTYTEVVQMESEIAADNADIGQMGYVFNARGRGALKTTPKFTTGGIDQGTVWESGNTVNGYRTEITNQIAQGDVFFGNFADVIIGMWGGLDLTVDPYSLSKSGGLRIVAFQDIDLVLRRVESMCYGSQTVA